MTTCIYCFDTGTSSVSSPCHSCGHGPEHYAALANLAGYDAARAAAAREAAMSQVEENADAEVSARALQIIEHLASTREEFTADAVFYLLDAEGSVFREPKALGPIMRRAAAAGLIVKTDRTVDSVRVSNHRRPVRVWRSLRVHDDAM